MKRVQSMKKNLILSSVVLLASCSDVRNVVEAPRVNIDPQYVKAPKVEGVDLLATNQWARKNIHADEATAIAGVGTRRLRVAIVSSGVDYNHPDLQDNIYLNSGENSGSQELRDVALDKKDSDKNGYVDDLLGWDVIDQDGLPNDTLGDGTAAAGVIGALHNNNLGIKGILGEVTIIPVRYIDSTGTGSTERLISAFQYLSKVEPKPDVILVQAANVDFSSTQAVDPDSGGSSFSFSERDQLKAELSKWAALDTPVIVSAGNRGSEVSSVKGVIQEFSKQPNVIVVTSVDQNDSKVKTANYSVQKVHITAPGDKVLSTLPGGTYGEAKGTFIAAAHVAGAVTLALVSNHGKISTSKLKEVLLSPNGSDKLPQLDEVSMGSSRLNVARFIEALKTPASN